MKKDWLDKYRDAAELAENGPVDVLVGFNANIDVIYDVEELGLDFSGVEPRELDTVSGFKQLKSALKYHMEREENREIELGSLEHTFEGGEERVGGQAGIMANYLSRMGEGVIFYTPLLSEELANRMEEKILYPVVDGDFVLKNVRDSVNTDRTKHNLIFEYSSGRTGRVIFSSTMKGFGPYFRSGIVDEFDKLDSGLDRIIVSGFHDAEGNIEAKIVKSRNQLEKLDTPVHLEYVHKDDERASLVARHVLPVVDSIGLDEDESREICELLDLDVDMEEEMTLGDAFHLSRQLMEKFELSRCHIHTYSFHVTVVDSDYEVGTEKIRDAMLLGELSAIKTADTGELPGKEDLEELETDDKHVHRLDELEDFQHYFGLDRFAATGTGKVEGYRVAAIPTIIHEDPERLVGLGDVISSGAFVGELK
ncbi:MAG: ADP-dependent glucokinase/phosphofructokinase [Candidatus Nanohaloarchaea archaeon]